jgi:hypothetical protein
MRAILLGPFGSMGSLNVRLRNICIEDFILETFFACVSIIRILLANKVYELCGAFASFVGTTLIAMITAILVLDGGMQCYCCNRHPVGKSFFFCGIFNSVSDETLMQVYLGISYFGIAMSVVSIIAEIITIADASESSRTAIRLPFEIGRMNRVIERDNAIIVIVCQIFISIPWRVYAVKVISGVLHAIYCAEVLKFPSVYGGDALRQLLPITGTPNGVDLAKESDIPVLAVLQYQSLAHVFNYIGLPPDRGPALIEAQWRSKGKAVLQWWLDRVGVIRDQSGNVMGALSLQLPGYVYCFTISLL